MKYGNQEKNYIIGKTNLYKNLKQIHAFLLSLYNCFCIKYFLLVSSFPGFLV